MYQLPPSLPTTSFTKLKPQQASNTGNNGLNSRHLDVSVSDPFSLAQEIVDDNFNYILFLKQIVNKYNLVTDGEDKHSKIEVFCMNHFAKLDRNDQRLFLQFYLKDNDLKTIDSSQFFDSFANFIQRDVNDSFEFITQYFNQSNDDVAIRLLSCFSQDDFECLFNDNLSKFKNFVFRSDNFSRSRKFLISTKLSLKSGVTILSDEQTLGNISTNDCTNLIYDYLGFQLDSDDFFDQIKVDIDYLLNEEVVTKKVGICLLNKLLENFLQQNAPSDISLHVNKENFLLSLVFDKLNHLFPVGEETELGDDDIKMSTQYLRGVHFSKITNMMEKLDRIKSREISKIYKKFMMTILVDVCNGDVVCSSLEDYVQAFKLIERLKDDLMNLDEINNLEQLAVAKLLKSKTLDKTKLSQHTDYLWKFFQMRFKYLVDHSEDKIESFGTIFSEIDCLKDTIFGLSDCTKLMKDLFVNTNQPLAFIYSFFNHQQCFDIFFEDLFPFLVQLIIDNQLTFYHVQKLSLNNEMKHVILKSLLNETYNEFLYDFTVKYYHSCGYESQREFSSVWDNYLTQCMYFILQDDTLLQNQTSQLHCCEMFSYLGFNMDQLDQFRDSFGEQIIDDFTALLVHYHCNMKNKCDTKKRKEVSDSSTLNLRSIKRNFISEEDIFDLNDALVAIADQLFLDKISSCKFLIQIQKYTGNLKLTMFDAVKHVVKTYLLRSYDEQDGDFFEFLNQNEKIICERLAGIRCKNGLSDKYVDVVEIFKQFKSEQRV